MRISKSSRHQKIIGQFGEHLVCNFLSRSGFETSIVDHTGLDVVAYNPETEERYGITVKSRTRNIGKETTSVNLFRKGEKKNDIQKLIDACAFFACEPWIAVYSEYAEGADLYLTSLENYRKKYQTKGTTVDTWRMGRKNKTEYTADPKVMHIEVSFKTPRWFGLNDSTQQTLLG